MPFKGLERVALRFDFQTSDGRYYKKGSQGFVLEVLGERIRVEMDERKECPFLDGCSTLEDYKKAGKPTKLSGTIIVDYHRTLERVVNIKEEVTPDCVWWKRPFVRGPRYTDFEKFF